MKRVTLISTAVIMALSAAPLTHAQFAFGGDAPILIDADKATYKGGLTVLAGKVDVRQDDSRIQSDTMDIYRNEGTGEGITGALSLGEVKRIDAKGNFKYTTPENTVTGARGVYEKSTGIITVTGNVRLIQPTGSTITGDKLIYDVKTKNARFSEQCRGEDCTGRVNFTIKQ